MTSVNLTLFSLPVMSFPADGIEGTYKNNIDDVRMYLDSKHTDSYVVINISQRTYRTNKLNDRVSAVPVLKFVPGSKS